jgi:diaminohydroxyphosphoribosylaminopyrimidine deaminase / 5-amino-6-(5-phosphoribosylamino)uracil reductase
MDEVWMRRALDLAARGTGRVSPNPLVGAVLVRDERVVGEGWHEGTGRAHAEIMALDEAGDDAGGATLYVTLEPCSHYGRTPPCAPRITGARVTRVVAAMRDPNPLVDGAGFRVLREAGIDVVEGVLAEEAARQNTAFLTHLRTGRPLVTLKMAASLDGKVAARDGSSRWITGEEARLEVHRMRAASDAILVGAGTAFRDDPSLTVRLPGETLPRRPLRVVVDGRGIVPPTHAVIADGRAPTLVATTERAPVRRRRAWTRAGAEVVVVDDAGSALARLENLLDELGKRDVQRLLVEGGPTLAWEMVVGGLVDEVVLFFAPILVGGQDAPSILMGKGIPTIGAPVPVDVIDVAPIGRDIKVVGRVHRDR